MKTHRNLVSGTDFSDGSEQALQVAIELAAATAARLTLVHVCELGADDLDDRRLEQCEAALARVVAWQRSRGIELQGVLRQGKPWEKLDNVAADVGARLIVIGRQGAGRQRAGVGDSAAMGSVAAQLVRRTSRSVLVVADDLLRLAPEAHRLDPL